MSGQQEDTRDHDAAARAVGKIPAAYDDMSSGARDLALQSITFESGSQIKILPADPRDVIRGNSANDILIIDDGGANPMQGDKLDLACEMANLVYERLGTGISTQHALAALVLTQQMINSTAAVDHRQTGVPFIQATLAETYAAIATLTDDGSFKVSDETLKQILLVSKDFGLGIRNGSAVGHSAQQMAEMLAASINKVDVPLNVPKIFQQRNRHRFNDQPHAERFSQKLEQRNRNMTIAVNSKLSKAQRKKLKRKEDKDISARLKAYHQRVRGGRTG